MVIEEKVESQGESGMKKYMLKILALGIAAGLVFSFAACGNEVTEENTTSETSTEPVAALEPVSVAETEAPTQTEPDSKTDGGSSDSGQDDYQSGASDDSGSGHQNGGGSGSGQTPQPDPTPTPNPDFDPDTVIEMVHQKIKANPDFMWFYDHPNVPPDVPCDMGWLEDTGLYYPTMTMEEMAQELYEGCLFEYNRNNQNTMFYVEYLGTRDDGCHRWKIYRGH